MKALKLIRRDAHRSALRVVVPFVLVGTLYIVASDRALAWITRDWASLTQLQTYKGVGFIILTAAMLYALVYWQLRRLLYGEMAERQQREQFRRAFEDAMTGVAFIWPDGRFLRVNPALCQMLGRTREELERLSVTEIIHPEDREIRAKVLLKLEQHVSRIEPYEMRYLTKDGRSIWVLASSTLCSDMEGQQYYVTQIVDVTKRREAEHTIRLQERQLMHASRLITLGEMASGLAHDLSQPISTILQYAETSLDLLQKGRTDKTESIIGALQDVVGQAEHTRQIVSRLRTLARKHTPEPRLLDVNEVIRETLRLLSPEAERRQALVSLEMQADLPPVRADPVQFQQLVINLFNNALEAMADVPVRHRRIVVRTEVFDDGDSHVRVTLSDSGPGLSPGLQTQVFDPFVTTKANGLGMGLSICKTIVEAHGGRLWHDSSDGMTHFHFDLPSEEVPACSTQPT